MNKKEAEIACREQSLVVVTNTTNKVSKDFAFRIEAIHKWNNGYWVFPRGKNVPYTPCVNISRVGIATDQDILNYNLSNIKQEIGL